MCVTTSSIMWSFHQHAFTETTDFCPFPDLHVFVCADATVYLPGWVSSEREELLTVSFIDGQQ